MAEPRPEVRRLERLVGSWRTSGQTRDDPPVALDFTDVYAWMPGGHFLEHRVDGRFGGGDRMQALEVIGWDEAAGALFVQAYDSAGERTLFAASLVGDVWRMHGDAMRFEGRFLDGDRRIEGRWDRKVGNYWSPWMDIALEKKA